MNLKSFEEAVQKNCRMFHNQLTEAEALIMLHSSLFFRCPRTNFQTVKGGLCINIGIDDQGLLDDFLTIFPGPYIMIKNFNPIILLDEHRITPIKITCNNDFLAVNQQYLEKIEDYE